MKTKTLLHSFMLASVVILTVQIVTAQSDSILWEKTFGGNNIETAQSMDVTSDGGFIIAGSTTSSNNGDVGANHGLNDYWIVKTNANGDLRWQKLLGGSADEQAQAIRQTSDGGFIVAGSATSMNGDVTGNHGSSDFWIVKLDSVGNVLWKKCYGGSQADIPYAMDLTSDGGCVVVGTTYSSDGNLTGDHSSGDYWIIKLDQNGNLQWQKAYGGSALDFAHSVTQSGDGGYLVSGFARSNDGDVLLNHGQEDMWILKLDQSGNLVWQRSFGGTGGEGASSLFQLAGGDYVLAGVTHSYNVEVVGNHGVHDFWVVKIDSAGNPQWKECIGGSDTDDGNCAKRTTDGGYVVTGLSDSHDGNATQNHGGHDFWIVKLRANGSIQWQKSLGGSSDEEPLCVVQSSDGNFVAVGYTSSNNDDVSGNHGNGDFWLVKIAAPVLQVFYADNDGDGYGNENALVTATSMPSGYVADFSDCNDQNPNIHPGLSDICNDIDDDCDSYTDEDGIVAAITPLASVNICSTSILTLTCTTTNSSYTYQWLKDGVPLNGATKTTFKVSGAGQYSIVISNGTCTANSPATIVKIISPVANVSPAGTTQVCQKTEVNFFVPLIAGISYQWKNSSGIIPGATTQKYSTSVPGTYFVTESDIAGCTFNSTSGTLQNYPAAKASITSGDLTLCAGPVALNALKKNGYTYQWYQNSKLISGATASTYSATTAGAYKYLATTTNGCTAYSSPVNVMDCKGMILPANDEDDFSLNLFPNPNQGEFKIDFHLSQVFSGEAEIMIRDSFGRSVTSQKTEINGGVLDYHMNLPADIKNGIYFVQLVINRKEYSARMIVAG